MPLSSVLRSALPAYIAALDPRVHDGLNKGAELIADRAKERAPYGTGEPHLRDAIHVDEATSLGGGASVLAGDDEVFYGHLVEFGTVNAPAQPFLIPAFEQSVQEVEQIVGDALKEV